VTIATDHLADTSDEDVTLEDEDDDDSFTTELSSDDTLEDLRALGELNDGAHSAKPGAQ
jgi:hypothetical protein